MIKTLGAIGFGSYKIKELNNIFECIVENATIKKEVMFNGLRFCEYVYEIVPGIGFIIRGEIDADNHFYMNSYLPFIHSANISSKEEVLYECSQNNLTTYCMIDDVKVGVSLIFQLLNMADYLEASVDEEDQDGIIRKIYLSALGVEGKILMPVMKDSTQIQNENFTKRNRSSLIKKARKGDVEALEMLTLDDFDTFSMVSKRAKTEDILGIVDSSMIPNGLLSDEYIILGDIKRFHILQNPLTNQEVCVMTVVSNDIPIEVCIGKQYLLGEIQVGRRFKGKVYLQGYVAF